MSRCTLNRSSEDGPRPSPGPTATLLSSSPRFGKWRWVFERSTDIPITDWMPVVVDLPGRPDSCVYMLDMVRVTIMQRCRLIEYLSGENHVPHEDVRAELDAAGCPILAIDLVVAMPLRLFP